ncbi:MAG TPA: site-specific integrase [Pyrinomonadaceae bacterium]|jgi:integrase
MKNGEDWRKKPRKKDGSLKTINGILYARIQFKDEITGKRKEKLIPAENRTNGRELVKEMRKDLQNHGEKVLRSDKMTFKELAEKYDELKLVEAVYQDGRKVAGRRSVKPLKSSLKPLVEHFGRKVIKNIKLSDLEAYKLSRLNTPVEIEVNTKVKNEEGGRKKYRIVKVKKIRQRKISTVNRELQLLRAIFRFAKSDKLISASPFDDQQIISASAELERDRTLSPEEERRLLAVCVDNKAHLRPLIITAIDTAMRRGELFKLCWRDVNFDDGIIIVQATNTKTEKTRFIGMTSRMKDELIKLWEVSPKDRDTIVFGITNTIKKSWKTACHLAGIEDLHFHDLRHTATTRLIRASVPQSEAMKITGHTQLKTFQRYMNLTNESVTASANLLDAYNKSIEQ